MVLNNSSIIKFQEVSKTYGNNDALHKINLTIPKNKIFVIVGPSGSGKTTLLKLINRLIDPTSGKIELANKALNDYDIRKLRLHMGYVLQNIALFPNLNIYENIGIQLKALHINKRKRLTNAKQLMQESGIDPEKFGHRMPNELSGGEQQRIGIIRALAINPDLILMDEPFSALDPIYRTKLQDLTLKLHRKLQNTIIFVTHDMNEALKMGDQIAVLHNGKLIQVDTPEALLQHPKDDLVRQMFKNHHQEQVYDLINAGNAMKASPDNNDMIRYDASIAELARELQKLPYVIVTFNKQKWQINTADLLAYLGKQGDRDHE